MFDEVSLGAPENAVGFVMWRIVAHYQREVDRALTLDNLTNLQFITLSLVAWFGREGTPVTQIELARSAGIHPMQVSQTLKLLETKKMISRRISKSDTRAKRVEVTKTGLDALHQALPKVIAVQRSLFGKAGRPGGSLLKELLRIDKALIDPAH
ncbi:regulatory protein MarR [Granulicella tundricola MP5ACTX9]|uniref:Regulatory protein MarR n=2 Tax=Granulicella TaxID=940557 RepID=E8WVI3_GRATM|nr:regulatory protein MarR [Granulicella tundricola MP5ACTX9]